MRCPRMHRGHLWRIAAAINIYQRFPSELNKYECPYKENLWAETEERYLVSVHTYLNMKYLDAHVKFTNEWTQDLQIYRLIII